MNDPDSDASPARAGDARPPAEAPPTAVAVWPLAAFAALVALAVVLPLVLAEAHPSWVGLSYGAPFLPFELLGLTGGVAILAVAGWSLHARRHQGLRAWLVVLPPALLALQVVTLQSEYAQRRFDYDCYEYAGRALRAGESPYEVGLIYLYPPLTAQAFSAAHEAVAAASAALGASAGREDVWDRVFYLYQCAQVLLVMGAFGLLVRLARDLGLRAAWVPALVAGLLLFDNAVFRTLRHGQINLWVLDASLVAVLLARSRPALAGAALAFAAHVKLYPLLLLVPLAVAARWRAALWTVLAFAAVVWLQSDLGRDASLWREYLSLLRADFPGEVAFRNASVHSVLSNAARLLGGGTGHGPGVAWGVRVATAGFAAWWVLRLVLRERRRRAAGAAADAPLFAAHAADALAFALLLSPSVWEHHYVMALPLALHACAASGATRPVLVALGLFAMLAMPTFDVFPLGYHRLAGMLALLASTPAAGDPSTVAEPSRSPSR